MSNSFPGFSPKAMAFFRQLEKNNKREWFQPRKEEFETLVRGPMTELVACVCGELRGFAVDHVIDPRKAIYRIHRDTRFSNDKTPYKTHIAATFPRAGLSKHGGAGYYFGISHEGVQVGGGMYMPGPEELTAVREAIVRKEKEFRKLQASKPIGKLLGEIQGESLVRVPKGYAPDHPAGDLLRRKQLYYFTVLPAKLALGKTITKEVIVRFKAMKPVVDFINGAILASIREQNPKEDRPVRPEPMF